MNQQENSSIENDQSVKNGIGIGDILKEARIRKQLSVIDITNKTHISKKYIEALETENFEIFPGEVYLKGFMSNIAEIVGVDKDKLITMYDNSKKVKQKHNEKKEEKKQDSLNDQDNKLLNNWKLPVIILSILAIVSAVYILVGNSGKVKQISTNKKLDHDVQAYELKAESSTFNLRGADKIKISIGDSYHILSSREITENLFEYSIDGDNDMLPVNKSIRKDLNQDNVNDIEITVEKIVSGTASVLITVLNYNIDKETYENIFNTETPVVVGEEHFILENTQKKTIKLYIKATKLNSYLNYIIDGERQKNKQLKPNEDTLITADEHMEITIGNYANTRVVLNDNYIQFEENEGKFAITKIIRWVPDPNNETRYSLMIKDY